jgi:hypothetical protein
MTTRLFPNFLVDESEYRASERYWEQMQDDILLTLGSQDEWRRSQPLYFGDGRTLMEPGNPIWDARSERLDRAYQIVQRAPSRAHVPEITAWIKNYEDDLYRGSGFPRTELVISLALSDQTAAIAHEILRSWMSETTSVDDMKVLLAQRLGLQA